MFFIFLGISFCLPDSYGIFVDARTKITNAYIFQWNSFDSFPKVEFSPSNENPYFLKLNESILNTEDNSTAQLNIVRQIIDFSNSKIPSNLYQTTKLYFYCTGAIRNISKFRSQRLLKAYKTLFKENSLFYVLDSHFKILTEYEEASYSWVSVNNLLGNFAKHRKTNAVLDLGYKNFRVAYAINKTFIQDNSEYVQVGSRIFNIFTQSFDTLGKETAIERMFNYSWSIRDGHIHNPCLFQGYKTIRNGIEHEGRGKFAECVNFIENNIIDPNISEKLPEFNSTLSLDVYAISYFAYFNYEFKLPNNSNLHDLYRKGQEICQTEWDIFKNEYEKDNIKHKNYDDYCFQASFMYSLLTKIGLNKTTTIIKAQKINGAFATYPIGAMQVEISGNEPEEIFVKNIIYYVSLGFLFLIGGVGGVCISIFISHKMKKSKLKVYGEQIQTISV